MRRYNATSIYRLIIIVSTMVVLGTGGLETGIVLLALGEAAHLIYADDRNPYGLSALPIMSMPNLLRFMSPKNQD
jgi:hypothetical protein